MSTRNAKKHEPSNDTLLAQVETALGKAMSVSSSSVDIENLVNEHSSLIVLLQKRILEKDNKLETNGGKEKKLVTYRSAMLRRNLSEDKTAVAKLNRSLNRLINRGKGSAKAEKRAMEFDSLREAVKDPAYFKRHGGRIKESLCNIPNKKLTQKQKEALAILKSLSADSSEKGKSKFYTAFSAFLSSYNPKLLIRATASSKSRVEAYEHVRSVISTWDIEKIAVKRAA